MRSKLARNHSAFSLWVRAGNFLCLSVCVCVLLQVKIIVQGKNIDIYNSRDIFDLTKALFRLIVGQE
jgi:hypothetical protein